MAALPRTFHLLATALLAGCASGGAFPSLSPRAAERGLPGGSAPLTCPTGDPAAPAPIARVQAPPPDDPQLQARVAELVGAARAGQAEFASLLSGAERAVANAGAAESENWIAAQQQVSRLGAARARTSDAFAELDSLGIRGSAERSISETDLRALAAAEEEVRALAERQEAEVARLSGLLSER